MSAWIMYGAPLVVTVGVVIVASVAGVFGDNEDDPSDESRPTKPRASLVAGVDPEDTTQSPSSTQPQVVVPDLTVVQVLEEPLTPNAETPPSEQVAAHPAVQDIPPTDLETEAEATRSEFNRNAWAKYQEFRTGFADSSIEDLLAAARSEPDPPTRAGIAFAAVERAVATGDLEKMNAAMSIVTSPAAEHGYGGMLPYDALKGEEQILEGGNLAEFDQNERFVLMQGLLEKTWLAYEYGDYALAARLADRATECSNGLTAGQLAGRGSSREEREAATEQLRRVRAALDEAEARTARFVGLSEAADNGSALSSALLDIELYGDWAGALDLLAESDSETIANAARLDRANPESSADLLAAAEAWRVAAASDSENASQWNNRSAALLSMAKVAASTQGLGGAAALVFNRDASNLAATLTGAGVDLDSPLGHQGYVEGKNGQRPAGLWSFNAQSKLTAPDAAANDQFGYCVAISDNTAIIGSRFDDDRGRDSGSVYLYYVTRGTNHKLLASDAAAGDQFGISVAISGNTALVGAFYDDDAGKDSGSAYLFDVTTGNQLFKLTASDAAAGDLFGRSVAINGNIAIVGAYHDDDRGSDSGSAYVFDVATGNQLFKLTAPDAAANDMFGHSVAISDNTALVGALNDDDAGNASGSAYLFDVTTGNQLFKLTASDAAAGDKFGLSVAISGNIAIVGAYLDDDKGTNSGSAYLFDVTTGNQLFKLLASDAAEGDHFGVSVAISGNRAIVGAGGNDDGGSDSGSAYLFDGINGTQLKLTASDAASGDVFGHFVAISGNRAIVGADGDGENSGSAYLFTPEP